MPAAVQLLALINADRASAGLPLMAARDDVTAIAVAHSTDMAAAGDIWHNDAYFTAETRHRLGAKTLGENVALNRSTADAHQRLMASPGHHANLANPKFTVVGLAVVRDAGGLGYITEDFVEPLPAGGGAGAAPAPSPGPSSGGGSGPASGSAAGRAGAGTNSPSSTSAPPSTVASASTSETGRGAASTTSTPGADQANPHRELAQGPGPATPSPTVPTRVPLWLVLVAVAAVILTARLSWQVRTA